MQDLRRRDLLLPAAIAIVAAGAMALLWQALRSDHVTSVANVVQATSYATRSELARRLIVQLESLESLAEFWISAAESERPDVEAPLTLIRFEGVDVVAWSGDDGARFVVTRSNPESGHVPTADVSRSARSSGDGRCLTFQRMPGAGAIQPSCVQALGSASSAASRRYSSTPSQHETRIS